MKFDFVRQNDDTDCGAACISTILKHYGYNMTIAKIRELAGTDSCGTSAYGLVKAAKSLGFNSKCIRIHKSSAIFDVTLPCIAHVCNDKGMFHYIVIHKITKTSIIIADPANGIIKLNLDIFLRNNNKFENNKNKTYNYDWTGIIIVVEYNGVFNNLNKSDFSINLFSMLNRNKPLIFGILLSSFLISFLGIISAFSFKIIIDEALFFGMKKMFIVTMIILAAINIIKLLLILLRANLSLYLSQKADIALLSSYYKHVIDLPIQFFHSMKTGEIMSRFADSNRVRELISGIIMTYIVDAVIICGCGIFLILQNKQLFIFVIISIVFYVAVIIIFDKRLGILSQCVLENNAILNSYLVESFSGIQTIKSNNAEFKIKDSTEKKIENLLKNNFKFLFLKNVQIFLTDGIEFFSTTIALLIGGFQVLNNQMTMGDLISFYALFSYFLTPVKNVICMHPILKSSLASASRLNEIFEIDKENDNSKKLPFQFNIIKSIEFNNVNFRYGTRKLVIKNIDININANKGKKIAFVGKSGSGKTTIAKLLLKFYGVDSGEILINNINITDIGTKELRNKITYVSQEDFLLSISILENLTLGLQNNVSMDDVTNACKKAQAYEFIMKLDLNFQTILDENGKNLSSGQRQRLLLARALLRDSNIYIFDEITSSIDNDNVALINSVFSKFLNEKIIIFITHQLDLIKNFDYIYVFDNGEIVQEGTHSELSVQTGMYKYLLEQRYGQLE